jgi:hypothetical protein
MILAFPGSRYTNVQGLNSAGHLVKGRWRNGVVTDLGFCVAIVPASRLRSTPRVRSSGNPFSCNSPSARSSIWENGSMADLGTLLTTNSGFQLAEVDAINDRGEIAGTGLPAGCSDFSCSHVSY